MCNFCDTNQGEIFRKEDGKWYMRVEGHTWNTWDDDYDYTDIEIVYCPHCGRKL